MWSIISSVIGALLNWVPDVLKYFTNKQEHKFEMERMKFQLDAEKLRYGFEKDKLITQAEVMEALAGLQADIQAFQIGVADTDKARSYGVKMASLMDTTLARGKSLGVWSWLIGFGWWMVLCIECLSSAIQPLLAVAAFIGLYCIPEGRALIPAVLAELIFTVIGFFLGGRVRKYAQSNRVQVATGQAQ